MKPLVAVSLLMYLLPHVSNMVVSFTAAKEVELEASMDLTPAVPAPIAGSYKPAHNGVSYFVDPKDDGLQIRKLRQYELDVSRNARGAADGDYDDAPHERCVIGYT
jgi:hypothetical protein